jgi:hypothetical protein
MFWAEDLHDNPRFAVFQTPFAVSFWDTAKLSFSAVLIPYKYIRLDVCVFKLLNYMINTKNEANGVN